MVRRKNNSILGKLIGLSIVLILVFHVLQAFGPILDDAFLAFIEALLITNGTAKKL